MSFRICAAARLLVERLLQSEADLHDPERDVLEDLCGLLRGWRKTIFRASPTSTAKYSAAFRIPAV